MALQAAAAALVPSAFSIPKEVCCQFCSDVGVENFGFLLGLMMDLSCVYRESPVHHSRTQVFLEFQSLKISNLTLGLLH